MNPSLAVVIVASFGVYCFERYLTERKREPLEQIKEIRSLLELHEKAIKNLGDQTLAEISKIKDRMGTLQIAAGLKVKQEPK